MKPITALLAVVALTAGCFGNGPQDPTNTAADADADDPLTNGTLEPTLMLRDITVSVAFTTPGFSGPYAGLDAPTCDPAQPGVCWVNFRETIYPTVPTPFNGTFLDRGHIRPDGNAGVALEGTFVFTGSIEGCTGSGTVTFPYIAEADQNNPVVVNPSGEVVHGHDYLSAPTDSTGFARIADANLDADYDINPITGAISRGMLTGTVSCQ